MNDYGLHSAFDIKKHKATFINYLEVVIDKNGIIYYATPSHQEKLIQIACEMHHLTRDQLEAATPPEYYFDFMTWLCMLTGAVAVWNETCIFHNILTLDQFIALKRLESAGLYRGPVRRYR